MIKTVILYIVFLGLLCSTALAQSEIKFDTAFSNTSSVQYFATNSSIKKIVFYTDESQYRSLSIYPKTIWQAKENENYINRENYESYNLDFAGDIYLLEKKYGAIQFPEKEIANLIEKACDNGFDIKGIIATDSIHLQLSYTCKIKPVDSEEKEFVKVETNREYVGGNRKLKKDLEEIVKTKNISLSNNIQDSVLIFTAVLNGKDSSMLRIELVEGNYSLFSQAMMDALIRPKRWTPAIQGGRPVKSYFKIFIRLQKDNSIAVDY